MAIDLTKDLMRELNAYAQDIKDEMEQEAHNVAKKTAKKLKSTSPRKTDKYRKGWRAKKVNTASVVHNATDYQLTHLLEHGHVNRDGSFTAARPHIADAEQEAIEEYLKKVEEAIKG